MNHTDDPEFFAQQSGAPENAAPHWIAELAKQLDRPADVRKWLTEAAKSGDTEAIDEDGSSYDDATGGAVFVTGRDGVTLTPISAEQQAIARRNAGNQG